MKVRTGACRSSCTAFSIYELDLRSGASCAIPASEHGVDFAADASCMFAH